MNALIFSHQRCGSSNLLRFIRQAFQVPAGLEVFNVKVLTRQFPDWRDASPEGLSSYFDRVLSKARVIKYIYGQHKSATDRLVTTTPSAAAIIFLYRQNAHASALSTLVARRVKNYSEVVSAPLGPISAEEVDRLAQNVREQRNRAIDHCLLSGRPVLSIPYEHLFVSCVNARRDRAKLVLDFLERSTGLRATRANFEAAFDMFLSEHRKINSLETYRFIENFSEIQSRFPEIFEL